MTGRDEAQARALFEERYGNRPSARAGAYSAGIASVLLGQERGLAMAWLGGPLLPPP